MKRINSMVGVSLAHAERLRLARAQSAMHTARLALARWSGDQSYQELRLARLLPPSDQARWHAAAQRDFCAWLDGGGFATELRESYPDGDGKRDQAAEERPATPPAPVCLSYR